MSVASPSTLLASLFLMPSFLLVSHQEKAGWGGESRSTILFTEEVSISTTLRLHSCETGEIQQPCLSSLQHPECKEGYLNGGCADYFHVAYNPQFQSFFLYEEIWLPLD